MLVATASVTPIVLPFVHIGMNQITPKGQFLIFKPGNQVSDRCIVAFVDLLQLRIVVGKALDFTELIKEYRENGKSEYVSMILLVY